MCIRDRYDWHIGRSLRTVGVSCTLPLTKTNLSSPSGRAMPTRAAVLLRDTDGKLGAPAATESTMVQPLAGPSWWSNASSTPKLQ
eukprot:7044998-Prymnesium_polylepis.1